MASVVCVDEPGTAGRPGRWRLGARWLALLVGLCGFGYRLVLLLFDAPPTNSDEATMGLAALHIARGHDFPVWFYGQHYMGTVEAYLTAPLFAAAGPSVFALRVPLLLLYASFVAAMYALARRLYDSGTAVLTVAVLAFGSDRVVKNQLIAGGGYPELGPAVALLFVLALGLGLGSVRRRPMAYGGCGLLAGLVLWVDWLALPYLAAAAVVLVLTARRELLGRAGLALLGGILLGAAPLLVYNLTAPTGEDSVSVFLGQIGGHAGGSLAGRLYDGVLFGVPMGTGMCAPKRCGGWSVWWGVALPALLVVSGVAAGYGLRRSTDRIRYGYRLAVVAAAAGTVLTYARSAAPEVDRIGSARYLSLLLVATPAVVWPLVAIWRRGKPLWRTASVAGFVAVLATATAATVTEAATVPATHRRADSLQALALGLRQRGITRIYSDYWSCNLITFLSREGVQCAVLTSRLRPGQDRYPPYRSAVAAANSPAYVLRRHDPMNAALSAWLGRTEILTMSGYLVYLRRR